MFDKNGDGHISTSELAQVMAQLKQNMSDAEVKEMVKSVDIDGSGTIEFNEFCVYMINRLKGRRPEEIRRKTFEASCSCTCTRHCHTSFLHFVHVMSLNVHSSIHHCLFGHTIYVL